MASDYEDTIELTVVQFQKVHIRLTTESIKLEAAKYGRS